MVWRAGGGFLLGLLLLLVGLSCIDENPSRPAVPASYVTLTPGATWTYRYVINDSARYWTNVLREEPVILAGDTVYALDFITDGQVTLTRFFSRDNEGLVYLAGDRAVSFSDTLLMILEPPVRLSPRGTGPGESWTALAATRSLKITPGTPPDTLVTEGYATWSARVLGEELITVPALDVPVKTLWVEYYSELDPWSPPELHSYFWYAEDIGPVRTIDLTYGGRTVNDLSEYVQGK